MKKKREEKQKIHTSIIELHIQFGTEAIQLNPWIFNSAILSIPIHLIYYFAELISINLLKRYARKTENC